MVSVPGLQIEQSGFKLWLGHCVVFLGKTLHLSRASQAFSWVF